MDAVLSALTEFGSQVQLESSKPRAKATDFTSKIVSDAKIQDLRNQHYQQNSQGQNEISLESTQGKVKISLIPIDNKFNEEQLCHTITNQKEFGTANHNETPDVFLDITSTGDMAMKLLSLMKIPAISAQTTKIYANEKNSHIIWIKNPTVLLLESARDLINQLDLNEKHLRIVYTVKYRK